MVLSTELPRWPFLSKALGHLTCRHPLHPQPFCISVNIHYLISFSVYLGSAKHKSSGLVCQSQFLITTVDQNFQFQSLIVLYSIVMKEHGIGTVFLNVEILTAPV